MMKITIYASGLLLVLGGCSTHVPEPSSEKLLPPPLPKVLNVENDLNRTNESYCRTLPQDIAPKLPYCIPSVSDLVRFEQSIFPYAEQNIIDRESFYDVQNSFESRYFTPWHYLKVPNTVQEIMWPMRAFKGGYGSNLQPVAQEWFEQINLNSNFETYGTINQKAISIRPMDVRAFPTDKPLYKNPALPGEGYPFDLLQNSTVHYNEPIFISHFSRDGAWCYIFTNSVSGWVKSDGVSYVDDQTVQMIESSKKLFLIEDNIPLYTLSQQYVVHSRIGMMLPLDRVEDESYIVKIVDTNNSFKEVSIPKSSANIGVSRFNKKDLALIGSYMLKNTYGWGGMYGERDCSSMIRDMMTPFGIWLPRNSSAQSKRGEVVSFAGLSNDEKLTLIKEKGVPFETIIYLKGHVVLYIGTYQDNVLVFHNIWGIRTVDKQGNKGRHVVGKAVITSLEFGSDLENYDASMGLISRIESMNIFTRTPTNLTRSTKTALPKKKVL